MEAETKKCKPIFLPKKITVFQDVRYSMKWGRQERARKILVSTSAGTALRTTTKNFR